MKIFKFFILIFCFMQIQFCSLHYFQYEKKEFPNDQKENLKFVKIPVRFHRVVENPGKKNSNFNNKEIAVYVVQSGDFEINESSLLELEYSTKSYETPNTVTIFLWFCSLGIFPVMGDYDSTANFKLINKKNNEVVKSYEYKLKQKFINSWILVPISWIPPLFNDKIKQGGGVDLTPEPMSYFYSEFQKEFRYDLKRSKLFYYELLFVSTGIKDKIDQLIEEAEKKKLKEI
ncbi:hypothetical protein P3G55_04660 [Leptospira sp. 96542]|nr:hypothetical protein [Leptospira sp. 96542]